MGEIDCSDRIALGGWTGPPVAEERIRPIAWTLRTGADCGRGHTDASGTGTAAFQCTGCGPACARRQPDAWTGVATDRASTALKDSGRRVVGRREAASPGLRLGRGPPTGLPGASFEGTLNTWTTTAPVGVATATGTPPKDAGRSGALMGILIGALVTGLLRRLIPQRGTRVCSGGGSGTAGWTGAKLPAAGGACHGCRQTDASITQLLAARAFVVGCQHFNAEADAGAARGFHGALTPAKSAGTNSPTFPTRTDNGRSVGAGIGRAGAEMDRDARASITGLVSVAGVPLTTELSGRQRMHIGRAIASIASTMREK